MPAMPMPPNVKALRAQHRREDTAYANQQLDAAIVHKSNCLKQVKQDNRKAVAFDMHCVVTRLRWWCAVCVCSVCLACYTSW